MRRHFKSQRSNENQEQAQERNRNITKRGAAGGGQRKSTLPKFGNNNSDSSYSKSKSSHYDSSWLDRFDRKFENLLNQYQK